MAGTSPLFFKVDSDSAIIQCTPIGGCAPKMTEVGGHRGGHIYSQSIWLDPFFDFFSFIELLLRFIIKHLLSFRSNKRASFIFTPIWRAYKKVRKVALLDRYHKIKKVKGRPYAEDRTTNFVIVNVKEKEDPLLCIFCYSSYQWTVLCCVQFSLWEQERKAIWKCLIKRKIGLYPCALLVLIIEKYKNQLGIIDCLYFIIIH